jgi:hypothetical protein
VRRRVLLGVLSVVALSSYFGFQFYKRASDPLVAGIPPRENADGTIDYVLAYNLKAPFEGLKGNYWVLRFTKHQYISLSGLSGDTTVGRVGGPAYTLRSFPNEYLVINMRKFGNAEVMQNDPDTFKHYDGRVDIQVMSSLQSTGPWFIEEIQSAQKKCAAPVVVSKRIVAYQEKNPPNRGYLNRCFAYYHTAERSIGYIFYDDAGAPIAILSCGLPTADESGICRASVFSKQPGSIIVTVYFRNLEPQILLDTIDKAIRYIADVTVARGQLAYGEQFDMNSIRGAE